MTLPLQLIFSQIVSTNLDLLIDNNLNFHSSNNKHSNKRHLSWLAMMMELISVCDLLTLIVIVVIERWNVDGEVKSSRSSWLRNRETSATNN